MKVTKLKKEQTKKDIKAVLMSFFKKDLGYPNLKYGMSQGMEILEKVCSDYPYSEADYDKFLKETKRLLEMLS